MFNNVIDTNSDFDQKLDSSYKTKNNKNSQRVSKTDYDNKN